MKYIMISFETGLCGCPEFGAKMAFQNSLKAVYYRQEKIMPATQTQPVYPRGLDRKAEWLEKSINELVGDLDHYFGDVPEYLFMPNLWEKIEELGFKFTMSSSGTSISDYDNNIFFHVDVLFRSDDKDMLIVVRKKLNFKNVQDHIERLEKMRAYANLHGNKRTFLGAVAGVEVTDEVREYVLNQGFYLIEPSRETFYITSPKDKPKEW